MQSLNHYPRYSSALSTRSSPHAIVLLAFALSACGGAEMTQASTSKTASSSALSSAASTPSFGTAADFAVLAGTAVTCTNGTIKGNVGVSPGVVFTQTSCPVIGTIHAGDTVAAQAQRDFSTAYAAFQALPCTQTLTTLDGQRLQSGVYCFDAAATSTGGVLTLEGSGPFVFKVGTLGTGALTGTNFTVVTPSGAPPACGSVFWVVADAVTLTNSKFVGTVLAGKAITLTGGTFNGDAFAKTAATITGTAVTACALGSGNPPPTCTDGDCRDDDGDKGDHDDDDGHHGDGHHGDGHDDDGHHKGGDRHHERGDD